jgi:hypothetical protein
MRICLVGKFAVGMMLGALTLVPVANAQLNSSESGPYANWEAYDAQNPPSRNFDGCLARQNGDFWLLRKKGTPLLLRFTGKNAPENLVGTVVKVHGRENYGAGARAADSSGAEKIIKNEINVDRFMGLSKLCDAALRSGSHGE